MNCWSIFLIPILELQHALLPSKCCEPRSAPQLLLFLVSSPLDSQLSPSRSLGVRHLLSIFIVPNFFKFFNHLIINSKKGTMLLLYYFQCTFLYFCKKLDHFLTTLKITTFNAYFTMLSPHNSSSWTSCSHMFISTNITF